MPRTLMQCDSFSCVCVYRIKKNDDHNISNNDVLKVKAEQTIDVSIWSNALPSNRLHVYTFIIYYIIYLFEH